ncbi:MAG: SGNH/GDSL hydrolase family protein [Fimbriimonas sp.]
MDSLLLTTGLLALALATFAQLPDSPVVFPKGGALPAMYPSNLAVKSYPVEPEYYMFSTPERSLSQIRKIQADMPAGTFAKVKHDRKPLGKTFRRLRSGGDLRLVAMGDSIVNDTMRSGWVGLLGAAYPKAKIEATVYVRGGGGCQHYRENDRIRQYVVPLKPDVVLIGGISQRSVEDIRVVIGQLRAELPKVEILLFTGAFGPADPRDPTALAAAAYSGSGSYGVALRAMAKEQNCAYFDLTTSWAQYVVSSKEHPYRFYRDVIHANEFGEQVLAKAMMSFWGR